MSKQNHSFLLKITPTFVMKHRMRFFAIMAVEKTERNNKQQEIDECISASRFWANIILSRNSKDKEALKYVHFPNGF